MSSRRDAPSIFALGLALTVGLPCGTARGQAPAAAVSEAPAVEGARPTEQAARSGEGAAQPGAPEHRSPAVDNGDGRDDSDDGDVEDGETRPRRPPPPPDLDAQARRLFIAGRDAYHAGRFAEAAELWERAFDLSGRPTLLLGLGDAYDRLRMGRRAASVLRQYLVLMPETDSREHLEARIRLLEDQEEGAPRRRRVFTYSLVAGAGAAGVLSGIYWSRARSRYDVLLATCGDTPAGCSDAQIGSVRSAQRVSRATLGLAVGAAIGAVISYFLEGRDRESPAARARRLGLEDAL